MILAKMEFLLEDAKLCNKIAEYLENNPRVLTDIHTDNSLPPNPDKAGRKPINGTTVFHKMFAFCNIRLLKIAVKWLNDCPYVLIERGGNKVSVADKMFRNEKNFDHNAKKRR